jgi:hypothetical protein
MWQHNSAMRLARLMNVDEKGTNRDCEHVPGRLRLKRRAKTSWRPSCRASCRSLKCRAKRCAKSRRSSSAHGTCTCAVVSFELPRGAQCRQAAPASTACTGVVRPDVRLFGDACLKFQSRNQNLIPLTLFCHRTWCLVGAAKTDAVAIVSVGSAERDAAQEQLLAAKNELDGHAEQVKAMEDKFATLETQLRTRVDAAGKQQEQTEELLKALKVSTSPPPPRPAPPLNYARHCVVAGRTTSCGMRWLTPP